MAPAGTHLVPRDEPIVAVRIPQNWKVQEHDEFIEGAREGGLHLLVVPVENRKTAESLGEGIRYIRNSNGLFLRLASRHFSFDIFTNRFI